ncbi:hypothetical protein [Frateuria sp. STR12]|uniref:hypothetical protein n=1 Tax=Frateuria hangzhouensis TaxID=2995589 RepID=UPI002260CFB7|nr:hypothetical protein [Frateuria sp. STR12]MCX7513064.1 hypothetical protein [Frateuria sp. STR12]
MHAGLRKTCRSARAADRIVSILAREATEPIHGTESELLLRHPMCVYALGVLSGQGKQPSAQCGSSFDAMFH